MRVGIGYDAHRLSAGRRLILGGVEIPFERGLAGWSDADVLTHAIMDALLGAAGSRDIGYHFPSNDPAYKDISSIILRLASRTVHRRDGWRFHDRGVSFLWIK
jgi:2-C-methyl-D-erythritol 4-phosphate cytidylyltransferase/2-C-methyl-D-erythritol 2,4-cyclodiphosphate synthase